MAKVSVSRAALKDIRAIGRYTQRQWGADQRRVYLSGLDRKFALLADNPEISPERSEYDPPVRIHRHERHLIVYLPQADGILVVRVLFSGMDIDTRLSRDE